MPVPWPTPGPAQRRRAIPHRAARVIPETGRRPDPNREETATRVSQHIKLLITADASCDARVMRTTVALPERLHERARCLAASRHESLSTTLASLIAYGLDAINDEPRVVRDPVSGFPTITLGHPVTAEQVADLIDEDL